LQISGALFDKRLDWTVGGFYLDTEDFNGGRVGFEGFGTQSARCRLADGVTPYTTTSSGCPTSSAGGVPPYITAVGSAFQQDFKIADPATLENISGFMHLAWHVTDQLNVSAGVRYSHEKKTYTFYRYYYWPTFFATVDNVRSAATESKWTPRVAVDYKFNDDLMVYASFATGFTAGGINGRPFNIATDLFSFNPETVNSYEFGVKSEWLDKRVRANLAVYYTDFTDMQLTLSGCPTAPAGCRTTSPFYVDNGGDSRIQGMEFELETFPVENWLIRASAGYNDFKYKEISPLANTPSVLYNWQPNPFGLTLDSPQTGVPKWTLNLFSQYAIQLGEAGTLTPGVDVAYRSRTYFGVYKPNPMTTQNGYTLVNASLIWRDMDDKWQVAFAVNNLTDKEYYVTKTDGRTGFGGARGSVGTPLQWTVSVRRNF
jgi:iron complex outermembrane receptor protein